MEAKPNTDKNAKCFFKPTFYYPTGSGFFLKNNWNFKKKGRDKYVIEDNGGNTIKKE